MKKLFYFTLFLLLTAYCMMSCERSLMNFEGKDAIYFDVRRGVSWIDSSRWSRYYSTEINYMKIEEDTTEVVLQLSISGQLADYPRPFEIEVLADSSTAVEGKDYDFKRQWEVPAGAANAFIRLKLYKQEDLLDTNRILMLKVKENEYFRTDLDFKGALAGRDELKDEEKLFNPDPRFHTINMKFEVAKPSGWYGVDYPITETNPTPYELGTWGAFTVKKYLLIMQLTGLPDEEFNKDVPSGKAAAIGEIVAKYLEEQFDKGEPVLEKDGRLMWVSAVKKWRSYQYKW